MIAKDIELVSSLELQHHLYSRPVLGLKHPHSGLGNQLYERVCFLSCSFRFLAAISRLKLFV